MGNKNSSEIKRTISSDLGISPKLSTALKRLDSKSKPQIKRRCHSFDSLSDEPWGWFEDFETPIRLNGEEETKNDE